MRDIVFRIVVDLPKSNLTWFWERMSGGYDVEMNYTTATNWTQRVHYTGSELTTVYRTSWTYMVVAIAVSLLGVIAVAPLYYGWWDSAKLDIGTFNPLEIAKAFDAPLSGGVEGDRLDDVVAQVGRERVRYGVSGTIESVPRLRMYRDSNNPGT